MSCTHLPDFMNWFAVEHSRWVVSYSLMIAHQDSAVCSTHFSGLSYSGAVLGTRDGSYPTAPDALQRLDAALGKAGIRPWELSFVDNR
eukprot:1160675-Pelagomonas_calceolata.AAC.17